MPDFPRLLKHITVWLLLATLVFLGVQAWQRERSSPSFDVQKQVLTLGRAADGHFHWPAVLHGPDGRLEVEFLIDTGASRTALSAAQARLLGLPEGRSVRTSTANGEARGHESVVGVALAHGPSIERLPVTVLEGLGDQALLGMDVLSRLRLVQDGRTLQISPRTPAR